MSYMRDQGPHERVHETLEAVDQLLAERRSLFMPRAWGQLCLKLFDALELEVSKHLKKHQHHDYYSAVYVSISLSGAARETQGQEGAFSGEMSQFLTYSGE